VHHANTTNPNGHIAQILGASGGSMMQNVAHGKESDKTQFHAPKSDHLNGQMSSVMSVQIKLLPLHRIFRLPCF
jgi:hypothetical protein